MEAARIPAASQLNTVGSGDIILFALVFISSTPMTITITATVSPAKYS